MNACRRVRADVLGDPGAPDDPADHPGSTVPVEPLPVGGVKNRAARAFADRQVNGAGGARCERDSHDLAALARDHQGPVTALEAEVLDVRAGRLRYPQPVS
jgi:hypothetical protein